MLTFLAIKVLEPFPIQSISFHSFCILTRFCELDHVLESVAGYDAIQTMHIATWKASTESSLKIN